ncbi:thyrotroph embryonic factor-like isoform X2 [Lampetra fluviatilis]
MSTDAADTNDVARPESPFGSRVLRALLESLQQRPALLPAGDADDGDDEKKLIAEVVLGMGGEVSPRGGALPPPSSAPPPPDPSGDRGIAASVARAAFLGPAIWDRTIPYDGHAFTLEYMDLDDFLSQEELTGLGLDGFEVDTSGGSEGGGGAGGGGDAGERSRIGDRAADVTGRSSSGGGPDNSSSSPRHRPPPSPLSPPSPPSSSSTKPSSMDPTAIAAKKPRRPAPEGEEVDAEVDDEVEVKVEFVASPTDVALSTVPGQEPFDPRRRRFSPDELKPQPIVKKARKVYVPDDRKGQPADLQTTKRHKT